MNTFIKSVSTIHPFKNIYSHVLIKISKWTSSKMKVRRDSRQWIENQSTPSRRHEYQRISKKLYNYSDRQQAPSSKRFENNRATVTSRTEEISFNRISSAREDRKEGGWNFQWDGGKWRWAIRKFFNKPRHEAKSVS